MGGGRSFAFTLSGRESLRTGVEGLAYSVHPAHRCLTWTVRAHVL
jgi:hypothetical protein